MRHFLASFQMSSDLPEISYVEVFDGFESKNNIKILVWTFLVQKTYVFFGWVPQKVTKN